MGQQRPPGLMVFSLVLPYLSAARATPTGPVTSTLAHEEIGHPVTSSSYPGLPTSEGPEIAFVRLARSALETMTMRLDPPPGTLLARQVGETVPTEYTELRQTFNAGYIVLSYVIAVVGSLCTLELLLRRTSNRGTHNVLLLVAAGICFGSVSTFSMHFIGNNSLTLHHPQEAEKGYAPLSLSYSAGYTILSLVVSCTAMTAAFFVMGLEVDWRGVVKKTGVDKLRRRGSAGTETDTEEDEEEDVNRDPRGVDLSQEVKKKQLQEVKAQMKRLERKSKMNEVMKKLEWALSWSMVTVPTDVAGDTRAERRTLELRRAEEKAKKLEEEIGGIGLSPITQQEVEDGMKSLQVVETVASDPVASGYDNPVTSPKLVPVAQVADRDLEDLSAGQAAGFQVVAAAAYQAHGGVQLPSAYGESRTTSAASPHAHPGQLAVQGSLPPSMPQTTVRTPSLFSPNFAFPSQNAPHGTHTSLNPFASADAPGPDSIDHNYPPALSAVPSHMSPGTGRRTSLPAFSMRGATPSSPFGGPISRDYARFSYNLKRITSFPENDSGDLTLRDGSTEHFDEEQVEKRDQEIVDQVMASARTRTRAKEKNVSIDAGVANSGIMPEDSPYQTEKQGERAFQESMSSTAALRPDVSRPDPEKASRHRNRSHGLRVRRHRERRRTNAKRYARWESWLGLDVVTRDDILKIVVTGTIAGAGVAGMHYIGQKSITSYPYIAYSAGIVVASVVIACVAVTVGLYIMFIILRPKLKHGWAVKIGVACILGVAVCCMHYCGMGGTTYAMMASTTPQSGAHINGTGNRAITGVVAALALVACIAILSFTIIQQVRQLAHKRQRRKVVIATMIYDQDDRLLVSPDGVVPLVDVESVISSRQAIRNAMHRKPSNRGWDTESSTSSVLDVDLTTSHPAFVSAIRSTWAWRQPGVLPAVHLPESRAGMSDTATTDSMSQFSDSPTATTRRQSMLSTAESAIYPGFSGPQPLAQNVGKFLDRFSTAVSTLARDVTGSSESVRRLGVLYDRLLTTGHVSIGTQAGKKTKSLKVTVAKGQMLFLVRRVTTQHEQSQLLARNYLFAEQSAVANVMAKVLAVPVGDFLDIMHDQTDFCDFGMTTNVKPGRLYGGLCVIQPTTSDGIQIVVEQQRRHQLPMREVCGITSTPLALRSQTTDRSVSSFTATVEELGEAARALSGQTLFDMIAAHNEDSSTNVPALGDDLSVRLRNALVEALIPMLDLTFPSKAMARILPRLTVTPTLIPLFVPLPSTNPKYATHVRTSPALAQSSHAAWIIMFKAILAVDTDCSNLDLEPWSLFRAQNECILRDGRESAAAMRAAALAAASASALNGQIPPEVNRGRRPSKVQWTNLGPGAGAPTTPLALTQVQEDPLDSAFFNVHSPAIDEKVMSPKSEMPPSRNASPHVVSSPDARRTSFTPSALIDASRTSRPRDLAITIPKTAMRAPAPQPMADGDGDAVTMEFPVGAAGREITTGVSFYHPDWLTRILREEMLPRANEEGDEESPQECRT